MLWKGHEQFNENHSMQQKDERAALLIWKGNS